MPVLGADATVVWPVTIRRASVVDTVTSDAPKDVCTWKARYTQSQKTVPPLPGKSSPPAVAVSRA
jgi:hypothetical protein